MSSVRSKEQLPRNALESRELHDFTCREAHCGNCNLLLHFLYLPSMQQPRRALAEWVPPLEGGHLPPTRSQRENILKQMGKGMTQGKD